jgi:hypothetical protein
MNNQTIITSGSTGISSNNFYFDNSQLAVESNGYVSFGDNLTSFKVSKKLGYEPELAFKYIKKKFGILERVAMDRRLKKLEKAVLQSIENGQDFLAEKMMREMAREAKESVLYAKGIRHFVERDDVNKVKHKIKGGHISDTKFKDYTRVIPKSVIASKKKYDGIFDDFIIYHYYNNEVEQKLSKKQKMNNEEIARMKDPILFGIIKETNRLYFIDDWEDEYCDLTFDEIIDVVGENKLTKYPELNL